MKRDVLWSALEAAGSALLSITAAFLIARLIGPEELGIGAAAVAVHVLLWVAVNALFADAIVQRTTIDETILSSAFWASTAIGCAAAAAQAGAGWLLARILSDDRLVPMSLLLALPFPFVGMGGPVQGLLTRQRRYRALALRTLIGQSAGMALGVGLAFRHGGAWALIVQQAAGSSVAALVLVGSAGWRPHAICRWTAIRGLLRIGLPLTASTLVQIGRYRVFAVLIGGTAGATALGQIHVAFRLADTIREITFTALWRLMLPILSEDQHDKDALLRQVDRLLRLSSFVTMPMCGGMAVTLLPLTALILGPAWRDAGVAAEPLVGLTALLALMFPSGSALAAVGRSRFSLYANVAGLVATVAGVLVVRPATPWASVLVWCGAQLFVTPYSLWVNARALGVAPLRPLREGIPMLLISAAAAGGAMLLDAETPLRSLVTRPIVFVALAAIGAGFLLRRNRAKNGAALRSGAVLAGSGNRHVVERFAGPPRL